MHPPPTFPAISASNFVIGSGIMYFLSISLVVFLIFFYRFSDDGQRQIEKARRPDFVFNESPLQDLFGEFSHEIWKDEQYAVIYPFQRRLRDSHEILFGKLPFRFLFFPFVHCQELLFPCLTPHHFPQKMTPSFNDKIQDFSKK